MVRVDKSVSEEAIRSLEDLLSKANQIEEDALTISTDAALGDYILVNVEYVSTNDLMVGSNISKPVLAGSIVTVLSQILVFMGIIHTVYPEYKPVAAVSSDLIIGRLFISAYLGLHLSNSLSLSLTKSLLCRVPVWKSKTFRKYVGVVFALPVLVFIAVLIGLYGWGMKGFHVRREHCLLWSESLLVIVACTATVLITKEQENIANSIQTFFGLMIVLDFDELVARSIPFELKTVMLKSVGGSINKQLKAYQYEKFALGGSIAMCLVYFLLS
jgi:hypothetical protein